tara:strand:+ start:266 stop:481 length:216 start_codon:yes stop_codon:yes gene_type:complete
MNTKLIAFIKAHALKNYETYEWSAIIECYGDVDIELVLDQAGATSEAQALNIFESLVGSQAPEKTGEVVSW